MRLPTPTDVVRAAERIGPHVIRTPLLSSPAVDELIGGTLLVKAESLQRTGSFKLRGAYNRLLQMSAAERARGVVAWSAGNHGQALAFAGRELGIAVTIIMPSSAPRAKIAGTRRWGAEVVLYDRLTENREEIGHEISNRTGALIVHPYDDADVIAGQGTAGLEAVQDAIAMGTTPTVLLCSTGGGGLIAGCALAVERLGLKIDLHPCEPEGFDGTGRSLVEKRRVGNDMTAKSICDALITPTPGDITFAVNKSRLSSGLAVDDESVREAMRIGLGELKLLLEPGGAAGLAAALKYPQIVRGKTTVVLGTGGNMDLSTVAAFLRAERADSTVQ